MAEGVFWPLFVYQILQDTLAVGIIGTLLAIGTILTTSYVGKLSDRLDNLFLLKIGATIVALLWILRSGATTSSSIYLLSTLAGFAAILVAVPISVLGYTLAKQESTDEFIILREVPLAAGRKAVRPRRSRVGWTLSARGRAGY